MILGYENIKNNLEFAYSGKRATDLIEEAINDKDATRYSLILMECKMPLMDGFDTSNRIRCLLAGIGMPLSLQP